ncbi:MAG: cytochrome c family protein [Oceanicaulis sp.]|nr:cytochrome c family protein [Oceanicaulis sp.]
MLAAGAFTLGACGDAGAPESPTGDTPAPAPAPEPAAERNVDVDAVLASLGEAYMDANRANGERLWRRCQSCHTVNEGGRHMVGPNLYAMFGQQAGGAEGFRYSNALQEADFVWTAVELDEWLANPRTFLPGNRMSFAGLRNESDRNDLIAWLAVATAPEDAADAYEPAQDEPDARDPETDGDSEG